MEDKESQLEEVKFKRKNPEEQEELEGLSVSKALNPKLIVRKNGDEKKEIQLPAVRILEDSSAHDVSRKPYGPDRAKVWKKANEWIQSVVIDNHPVIQEKRYQNRKKSESAYLHNKEDPDLYEWQEDEETLEEIRPIYSHIREALEEMIGKPRRSDFADLYPHKYDDPGLSERARRIVRDLKAVFGSDILKKE